MSITLIFSFRFIRYNHNTYLPERVFMPQTKLAAVSINYWKQSSPPSNRIIDSLTQQLTAPWQSFFCVRMKFSKQPATPIYTAYTMHLISNLYKWNVFIYLLTADVTALSQSVIHKPVRCLSWRTAPSESLRILGTQERRGGLMQRSDCYRNRYMLTPSDWKLNYRIIQYIIQMCA